MNAAYSAIGCILMILVIYWGSAEPEPQKLTRFFGLRTLTEAEREKIENSARKKGRR